MALRTLDERHRLAAELLVRGRPKSDVARKLGIARNTLYAWMEDPLWVGYFAELLRDFENARDQRLGTVVDSQFELLERSLAICNDRLEKAMAEGTPAAEAGIPALKEQVDAIERLMKLRRLESGLPGDISESRRGAPARPDGRIFEALDRLTGRSNPRPTLPPEDEPEGGVH